jgi:PhnB protein
MENATKYAADNGVHSVTPHLVCDGANEAIEFYKKAFGAREMIRLAGPDGKLMHGCVSINGSSVMLADEAPDHGLLSPRSLNGTPVSIHLTVEDTDASFKQAVDAGAKALMEPGDMFWGARYCVIEDPFGHHWSISTPQRDMSEAELREAASKAMAGEAQ